MGVYYWFRMHRYPSLLLLYRWFKKVSKSTGVNIWDAVILYELVRENKPKYILEFGTGASTAYMALALKDNEKEKYGSGGTIVSIESEKSFFDHQQQIFPGELRSYVEFVHSPVGTKEFDGELGFVYGDVPVRPYDLIWVDGPALTDSVPFSGDVVEVLPICPRQVRVLFDGRDLTAQRTLKMIGDKFLLKKYPFLHMSEIVAR
jgi:Methyltransferase domain